MSLRVVFLSGADSDLQEVFNRFEDYRTGFGAEFMTVVDAYLQRIAVFPQIAPLYVDRIRRQVVSKFPFGIFYEVHATRILIVAILDLRQEVRTIYSRLRR